MAFNHMQLDCLGEEALGRIHNASVDLLEKRGIVVHDPTLREIARSRGARVDNETIHFPGHLVEAAIESAPAEFEFHSRNHDRNVVIGRDLVLSPAHGHPFIMTSRGRRPGTLQDYTDLIKLTHQSPSLNLTGGIVVEPADVANEVRHVTLMAHLFRLTDKPLIFVACGHGASQEIIAMTALAMGVEADRPPVPAITLSLNPVSPLRWDAVMAGTMRAFSGAGQPVVIAPAAIMGVTGPVSPLGTCVLQNTEILSGITLVQMIRPGAPVVYAPCSAAANLSRANFIVGSPESLLMNMAGIQMARRYKVPCRMQANITDAKGMDYQAGYECSFNFLLQALALGPGAYISQAVGSMDSYMSVSPEKFVADDEICQRYLCVLDGLDTSADNYALDTIFEVGPDGNYLTHDHTYAHFRERWQPTVADSNPYSDGQYPPQPDFMARARARADTILAEYRPPALDSEIAKELDRIVQQHRAGLK